MINEKQDFDAYLGPSWNVESAMVPEIGCLKIMPFGRPQLSLSWINQPTWSLPWLRLGPTLR